MTDSNRSKGWVARLGRLYHRRPIPVLGAAAIVLGTIFVFVTPLNVAARVGSYPGLGWVLHTYMKNWSRNWSIGVNPPIDMDMSDPALVRLGAGYFESGCAPCHGTPGRERSPLVHMMEPPPPSLGSKVGNFSDRQLYWIIWNGIRYSGMPGWTGDDRQDEVWAMVAFLRQYPSLSAQDYVQQAYGHVQPEPPRVFRRPQFLREWGHDDEDNIEEIFAGGSRAGCPNGFGASSRSQLTMGGDLLHCGEDRLRWRDAAQLGAPG